MRTIIWFSCGAASAVAGYLALKENPEAIPVYIDTRSEYTHQEKPDNIRFLKEVEKWYGKEILIISSDKYKDVDDVIEKTKYMSGNIGAPCTIKLKKEVRFAFQRYDDIHVFGYTFDTKEIIRAERLRETNFELSLSFPLIEKQIDKNQCLAIIKEMGIELPIKYKQGFEHNNCDGCVKSSSPLYWALTRKYSPNVFNKRVEQSNKYKVKLVKADKLCAEILGIEQGERFNLELLPTGIEFPRVEEPSCDFLCQFSLNNMDIK